ncbi:ankyrin repeat domain-containing protein [Desulfovibrio subterraneus]|uniref:ankyrin repeat domain-containing protein n=1 Tax=Desulfovibrio subterraneus TaxID=2718620 RepID=UPI0022B89699|nr:ankyrin repeat domain-containing protein [Desulfovibrio subterraneus]WBF66007.1 ankyrin repeat domain-containing protein [Desulfovibrio subterraneus]
MKYIKLALTCGLLILLSACILSQGTSPQRSGPVPLRYMTVEEMLPGKPLEQQLAAAASKGDIEKMDALVAAGADVNARGAYQVTVPYWVLMHPNYEGFVHLLELGADSTLFDTDRVSFLHFAIEQSPQIGLRYLKAILEIGKADPNLAHPDHPYRPVETATDVPSRAAFVMLVNAGAEIDFNSYDGSPFVADVMATRDYELAYYLLQQGVSITSTTNYGFGVKRALEIALERQPWNYVPSAPQYMWFWRCVDFVEKRGMKVKIPPDAQRPAVLDTIPPRITTSPPRKVRMTGNVIMHEVSLTYPIPIWAQTVETMDELSVRSKNKPGVIMHEVVPKGENFETWSQKMALSGFYGSGASLESFTEVWIANAQKESGGSLAVQAVETADDHRLTHLKSEASDFEMYLYTGRYKDTFVVVSSAWHPSMVQQPEGHSAHVLRDMQKIRMDKGLNVVPMN